MLNLFNQYESNVKATIAFIRLLNIKVNNTTVNETLKNHPDWPSLLCISDSLNKWDIPNAAGRIDINKIDELPTPFIAYTSDEENPLAIVTEVTDTTIQVYQKNYNKQKNANREEFLTKWDGIHLIAEPNEHSGELRYKTNKQKAFFNSLIPISAFATLIIFSVLLLTKNVVVLRGTTYISTIGIYLQYLILLSGIVVTSLLLWYEIDSTNPILQKVCTSITKGNCNAILIGKQAKVFKWLSWSEVGFFYFTGSLFTLLFSGNATINSIRVLAWINILALPYTVFSVYYQWKVAKQWCVLCLEVQALLMIGGINVFANNFLFPLFHLSVFNFFKLLSFYLLPILMWYAIRPYIYRMQQDKSIKREYLRIKFNTEIFEALLKKQKALTIPTEGLGIDLGNPSASEILIKVCNPYCAPCSKAHSKIEELLETSPNLKVKIIFTAANKAIGVKVIRHLLAISEEASDIKIQKALDDWYLPEKKDYEHFAAKYPMNGELLKQDTKIEAMQKWCEASGVSTTPTIFINGYKLPNAYGIEDLQYFLLE